VLVRAKSQGKIRKSLSGVHKRAAPPWAKPSRVSGTTTPSEAPAALASRPGTPIGSAGAVRRFPMTSLRGERTDAPMHSSGWEENLITRLQVLRTRRGIALPDLSFGALASDAVIDL